ncbi:MAG: DNA translocase FtsK 4TM domain-containing protein [Deltaproteobacteria bacterium]|nr:DNA translocase FtsK 4TM domain-containing protein [Deltaproteobacteria bacterium]
MEPTEIRPRKGKTRRSDKRIQAKAKKPVRVRRGSSVLARDDEGRSRSRLMSIRAMGVSATREIGGLVALAASALFLLSLLSFHPRDRLVGQWGDAGAETIHNWIGPLGATLADATVGLLGLTAFALPPLLLLAALAIFGRERPSNRWLQACGFALVLGSLALLVQLAFPDVPFRGARITGGGGLGELLAALGLRTVSTLGSGIVGTTTLLIGARLAFGMRMSTVARGLGRGAQAGAKPIVGVAGAGVRGAKRGVQGGLGSARGWLLRWLDELSESRALAREERRFAREERIAILEEERLLGAPAHVEREDDRELPELELDPSVVVPAPQALVDERAPRRSSLFAAPPVTPPVTESAEAAAPRRSRVRIPTAMQPTPPPAAVPEPPGLTPPPVIAPIPTQDGAELPVLNTSAVAARAPEPNEDSAYRVDSLRGATGMGIVHAEIRRRGAAPAPASAAQLAPPAEQAASGAAPAPVPAAPARKAEPAPQLKPSISRPRDSSADEASRRRIRRPDTSSGPFELPAMSLLKSPPRGSREIDEGDLEAQAARLEETLGHYNVKGRVTDILPGPVVTMFEFEPAPGIKVSRIANLENDLAMALRATRVRIVAPIPGKGAVGIEIPSKTREIIYLKEILASNEFRNPKLRLPLAIGKAIDAQPVTSDWAKMPHILVAGTTGSGKSVCVNSFILSLLYSKTPDELRMILVDPKMLEFSIYDGIPHLLVPVVTSPKKAAVALRWAVEEMTRRYKVLAAMNVRNIIGYNEKAEGLTKDWAQWQEDVLAGKDTPRPDCGREKGSDNVCFKSRGGEPIGPPEKMPYIVIVIDELADLMMVARKEVEESIVRLAQMARAAGIHMLLATQRPSVDVITGLIKANFPTRLSFKVSSKVDSRTVLDANGAENLLGMGDGLFLPPGSSDLKRIHGAFVSDEEVEEIVAHLKSQGTPRYVEQVLAGGEEDEDGDGPDEELDAMYDKAVACVAQMGKASTSLLQRKLGLGYNRAARIMDSMERNGVIGPANGAKPRQVFANPL